MLAVWKGAKDAKTYPPLPQFVNSPELHRVNIYDLA